MFRKFLSLEWKSFLRSSSFKANLAIKIFSIFALLYVSASFLFLGVALYYGLEEADLEPLPVVNRFLIAYLVVDLIFRHLLQKLPVMNIRPLLYLNIKKDQIVGYALGKGLVSPFNWMHLFLLIPFTVVLLIEGFSVLGTLSWFLGVFSLLLANNFLNILGNNNRYLFYSLAAVIVLFAAAGYYGYFDATIYFQPLFQALYEFPLYVLLPIALTAILGVLTFRFYRNNLYLDGGLALKQKAAKTEDFSWLNRFGTAGTFIKNDIRLIKRNKRARTTVVMSFFFLFYGLLFFTSAIEMYDAPVWKIFGGLFVTGGFIFSFGQFVPSWDSSYYPLMMTQNIQYREYLTAKWWLMIIATLASALIGTLYLFLGLDAFLAVLVTAIFNMGVNSHLVLLSGAYIKTPIDLSKNNNLMGDKQSFNLKTLLITLPKIVLPLALYAIGHYLFDPAVGYILVAAAGVLGFVFRNRVFTMIERIYKTEKYETIAAYKQG